VTASTNGDMSTSRHRVVIVGAGFAGLRAARALRHAPVDVTVVDRANHHLFQPLLHQVATGALPEGDIAPPVRDVLRHQRNAQVLLGDVTDIDLDDRQVVLQTIGTRRRVGYDSLIVAAGARQSYVGHDEFALHAPTLKTIDDALKVRGRIFGAFELAELEPRPERRDPLLTFVIVGAGPTGVELAGQIAELSRRALKHNFRTFNPADVRIIVIDGASAVLPAFPEPLQRRARRDLQRLGVEVRLHSTVTSIDPDGVDVTHHDGSTDRIQSYAKIWAGGVQASPLGRILVERSDAALDSGGRVFVEPDCTLPGHPEVFVVGDLMSLRRLPDVADVARQSGRHVARTIKRRLRGHHEERPFRYRDHGTYVSVARFRAVAPGRHLRLRGFPAWVMWLCVHLVRLTGFRRRMAALAHWAVALLRRARRQRTTSTQHVFPGPIRAEAGRPASARSATRSG
jgi:NADH:ubiquinone reductase (H+-translocating)